MHDKEIILKKLVLVDLKYIEEIWLWFERYIQHEWEIKASLWEFWTDTELFAACSIHYSFTLTQNDNQEWVSLTIECICVDDEVLKV